MRTGSRVTVGGGEALGEGTGHFSRSPLNVGCVTGRRGQRGRWQAAGSQKRRGGREENLGVLICKCNPEAWKWVPPGNREPGEVERREGAVREDAPIIWQHPSPARRSGLFSTYWWDEGRRDSQEPHWNTRGRMVRSALCCPGKGPGRAESREAELPE